ncbi:MAG TPA: 1-(5-phosphoribosyl)-5-[(5-phosphoribosylamino)methylideneamino]imidazole-4-carboxamide isomerase [Gemmataceae bacterium]|nr:1-(5-phosphoribosyl)-5-[(5-phosphoribosylamino)methylideneamino]imidazole-4-carboxamide isomerase [Gemmataceae bacterium]
MFGWIGRRHVWGGLVLILPAIDLRGGQCVRLRQGDYAQETVFDTEPGAVAARWVQQGASYLHLVDLDGAREGRPVNADAIRQIVRAASVPCELGGGLRTVNHIRAALDWGIDRVVIGTRALKEPGWLEQVSRELPGKIVLGIDARNGRVATEGWLEVSERPALDLARQCADWPLAALVYTDISRDGMLEGPNVAATAEIVRAVRLPVIASGGVTTLDDVRRLARTGVAGCIIGRALYEGRLSLSAIIQALKEDGERQQPGP